MWRCFNYTIMETPPTLIERANTIMARINAIADDAQFEALHNELAAALVRIDKASQGAARQTTLFHILSGSSDIFDNIDYDGTLEALVAEFATKLEGIQASTRAKIAQIDIPPDEPL